jgi:hypothetical protein
MCLILPPFFARPEPPRRLERKTAHFLLKKASRKLSAARIAAFASGRSRSKITRTSARFQKSRESFFIAFIPNQQRRRQEKSSSETGCASRLQVDSSTPACQFLSAALGMTGRYTSHSLWDASRRAGNVMRLCFALFDVTCGRPETVVPRRRPKRILYWHRRAF